MLTTATRNLLQRARERRRRLLLLALLLSDVKILFPSYRLPPPCLRPPLPFDNLDDLTCQSLTRFTKVELSTLVDLLEDRGILSPTGHFRTGKDAVLDNCTGIHHLLFGHPSDFNP